LKSNDFVRALLKSHRKHKRRASFVKKPENQRFSKEYELKPSALVPTYYFTSEK
jgi:hypothetical protein